MFSSAKSKPENETPPSVFDGVPNALPALAQAAAYHERAARTGFDWSNVQEVLEKLQEEITEVLEANTDAERRDEVGDMLTVGVNIARWLKVEPETALHDSNRKFKRRFQYIEQHAGRPVNELTFDQMEALWAQAKSEERRTHHNN